MYNVLILLCFNMPYVIYGIIYFLLIGKDVQRFHRDEHPQWGRESLYMVYAGIGLLPCVVCVCLIALWIVHPDQTFAFYPLDSYFFAVGFLFYISELWLLPRLYTRKSPEPAPMQSDTLLSKIWMSLTAAEMASFFFYLVLTPTPLPRLFPHIFTYVSTGVASSSYVFFVNIPTALIEHNIKRRADQKPKE